MCFLGKTDCYSFPAERLLISADKRCPFHKPPQFKIMDLRQITYYINYSTVLNIVFIISLKHKFSKTVTYSLERRENDTVKSG